jgi:hypothetical protein
MPAALTLSVPDTAIAGGEATVTVSASAPVDGVKVSLIRHETYRYKKDAESNSTSLLDVALDLAADTLSSAETREETTVEHVVDVGRVNGRTRIQVAIPADATPSTPDLIDWRLRAFVDEADGPAPAERPLHVRAERPTSAQEHRYDGNGKGAADLRLEFEHGAPLAFAGETLKATLVIEPIGRRVNVQGIGVGLVRLRGDANGQRAAEPAGGGRLAGRISVGRRQPQRFPLEIPIPADAAVTVATEHNWTRYQIGVSAKRRRFRRDLSLHMDLFVAGPRTGAAG